MNDSTADEVRGRARPTKKKGLGKEGRRRQEERSRGDGDGVSEV